LIRKIVDKGLNLEFCYAERSIDKPGLQGNEGKSFERTDFKEGSFE